MAAPVPHRLPRPLRLALYAVASAILLAMCLTPQEHLPQPGFGDKWEHFVAWAVLVLTGLTLSPRRPIALAAYAVAFGMLVEGLQWAMGFGRDADWRDVVADSLGVVIGLAIFAAVRLVLARRRADAEA